MDYTKRGSDQRGNETQCRSEPTGKPGRINPGGLGGITNKLEPPINLVKLTDPIQKYSIESFRGKPLVANFWGSWRVPCRVEMPLLESALRVEHGSVLLLAIDSHDTANSTRAFLLRFGVSYLTVFDPNGNAKFD